MKEEIVSRSPRDKGKGLGQREEGPSLGCYGVTPQRGPERLASLGSRQAPSWEALGIPAAWLLISPVMGAGRSCCGRSWGLGTIGACLLTEMTNGGSERGCASVKESMDKRKYQAQIAVMIFKGRLLKAGETLECPRAHVGTCLSVRLEVTVVAGSVSVEAISAAWTPELRPFCVLWEDQRSDRLILADGWVPNVKCKRKEKSCICDTKELLHEKKAPCSAEDVTWISSDSISVEELGKPHLLPIAKGGELRAPRSNQEEGVGAEMKGEEGKDASRMAGAQAFWW